MTCKKTIDDQLLSMYIGTKDFTLPKTRNIGIIAHIDAGKQKTNKEKSDFIVDRETFLQARPRQRSVCCIMLVLPSALVVRKKRVACHHDDPFYLIEPIESRYR